MTCCCNVSLVIYIYDSRTLSQTPTTLAREDLGNNGFIFNGMVISNLAKTEQYEKNEIQLQGMEKDGWGERSKRRRKKERKQARKKESKKASKQGMKEGTLRRKEGKKKKGS